jgi:hypothetical protein
LLRPYHQNPTLFPNSIEWAVLSLLRKASVDHILLTEVPFIKEFLACPSGHEREYFKRWDEYWSKIDFAARHGIAPM